jgi:hypothetical protein
VSFSRNEKEEAEVSMRKFYSFSTYLNSEDIAQKITHK